MLEGILNHAEIEDWFSKKWTVKTEVPVLPSSGLINRLDRVLLKEEDAIVIDFKSGNVESKHKSQVRHYSSLLSQMGYKNVSGYILYLEPIEIVHVM